jgi:hypothetical protein
VAAAEGIPVDFARKRGSDVLAGGANAESSDDEGAEG